MVPEVKGQRAGLISFVRVFLVLDFKLGLFRIYIDILSLWYACNLWLCGAGISTHVIAALVAVFLADN